MIIEAPRNEDEDLKPLVFFFNPNAVFYEYLNYQTEWLDFYTKKLKVDLVVFNYPGYGRSKYSLNILEESVNVVQKVY